MKILSDAEHAELTRKADLAAALIAERNENKEKVCRAEAALAEKDAAHAKAMTDTDARHKTELDAKEADVERRASAKAAEIVAQAGIEPVAARPGAGAKAGTLLEQLESITDPTARARFIAANRAGLLKEASAAQTK